MPLNQGFTRANQLHTHQISIHYPIINLFFSRNLFSFFRKPFLPDMHEIKSKVRLNNILIKFSKVRVSKLKIAKTDFRF